MAGKRISSLLLKNDGGQAGKINSLCTRKTEEDGEKKGEGGWGGGEREKLMK